MNREKWARGIVTDQKDEAFVKALKDRMRNSDTRNGGDLDLDGTCPRDPSKYIYIYCIYTPSQKQ